MDPLSTPLAHYPLREGWGHRFRSLTERHRRLCEEMLPNVQLSDGILDAPQSVFSHNPPFLWLEIGFGNGEHLARCAQQNPHDGYIGCEIFPRGIIHLMDHIEVCGLQNVRVTSKPALKLLERLVPACLKGVFILYPDPWPKTRHYKRRLISDIFVEKLAHALMPGGSVRIATDHAEYASWILARFLKASSLFSWSDFSCRDWSQPWDGWESTAYERKALKRKIRPVYLTFVRR